MIVRWYQRHFSKQRYAKTGRPYNKVTKIETTCQRQRCNIDKVYVQFYRRPDRSLTV